MSDAIDLVVPCNAIERLRERRVLTRMTHGVLQKVFQNGGFIAGGFARVVASKWPVLEFESILQYLQIRGAASNAEEAKRNVFWRAGSGDIDVFFPSQVAVDTFLSELPVMLSLSPHTFVLDSAGGYAKEIVADGEQRIQAITKYFGTKEEVVSTFDIHNAMCTLTATELSVPRGFHELERNGVLHLNRQDSPWLFSRLYKWRQKHGYKKLSPVTAKFIGQKLIDMMRECADKQSTVTFGNKTYSLGGLTTLANRFQDSFSNDVLLELSLYYGKSGEGYNHAFETLVKRAVVYHDEVLPT